MKAESDVPGTKNNVEGSEIRDFEPLSYRLKLQKVLLHRKAKNGSYSLRAFSRDLGVSLTALHGVLSGTRHLSEKNLRKVAQYLSWSPAEYQEAYKEIKNRKGMGSKGIEELILEEDRFQFISQWYYFAILNLAKLPDNQATPEWVAERLGLPVNEMREAIERLIRLEYLEVKAGQFKRKIPTLGTSRDIPSVAIRSFHHQTLETAAKKLDEVPVDEREFSAMTMAVNTENLALAKKELVQFQRKMSALLEKGTPNDVYTFSFQLFPVTTRKGRDNEN